MDRAWVCAPRGALRLYRQQHSDLRSALAGPDVTKMASDSKPKKAGLRSRLRHLLSSKSTPGHGRDEPITQDPQALIPEPSLPGDLKGLTPSSGEGSHVPVVRAENTPSPIEPSTSTSMFSRARHFKVGDIHIQQNYNGQDKLIDGRNAQC